MIRQVKREIARRLKGTVRRQTDRFLPTRETREYRKWIAERIIARQEFYREPLQPGLLSIITAVWDGSPVPYLMKLAETVAAQNEHGACEWVILDNGCSRSAVCRYLAQLSRHSWVKTARSDKNIGITQGLRLCLERATGRYVLPVDADDWIYHDALRIVTWGLRESGYPPLLFTDEDKLIRDRHYQPYLKPAWDPILLLNSAYIAHLGVVDREKALALGAYRDGKTEASPDWDLFIRFLIAGFRAMHLPEVVYSWRVHAESTADDAASKSYVSESQRAVLQHYLDSVPAGKHFEIENNPLLPGAPHWHFIRSPRDGRRFQTIVLADGTIDGGVQRVLELAQPAAEQGDFVHFIGEDVDLDNREWVAEVLTLAELHPDIVMIGGRIRNRKGLITGAGQYFGVCGVCGCPHRGRSAADPGYFAQIWKQRSVSAVNTQFAVLKARFLLEIASELPAASSPSFLGAWIGAQAWRRGKRVVYSPFLSGISDIDWESLFPSAEQKLFARENHDLIPDTRFYSPAFSLTRGFELGGAKYPPRIQAGC